MLINAFKYRPEVDGFRAIAILAVVFYHAGFGFPGGYVGVDVFFVISGYLISSLIWKDLENGQFTFAHFWERRARRIVPVLTVVTLVILAVSVFLFLPGDLRSVGRAVAAQGLFAANFNYWLEGTGYFAAAADQKPLLHTWSLAVEEQFYFMAPLLFWGLFRFLRSRRRIHILAVLAVLSVISFVWSVIGVKDYPSMTFYLLPGRAWELLLGSMLAFAPSSLPWRIRRGAMEAVSWAGLGLILYPVFFYTSHTPFPGVAALPPCLGTALLIWSTGYIRTSIGSLFALKPLVFIGLISYSFYLWHWPLLTFSRYASLVPLSALERALLVGLSVLLSVLSWKYVEMPFRPRKVGTTQKTMLIWAVSGLAVVFCAGLLCRLRQGFPGRFSATSLAFSRAAEDLSSFHELSTADIQAGRLTPLGQEDVSHPAMLVWGDSHAMAATPAFDALLKGRGQAGFAATHSSTPPVLNWQSDDAYALPDSVSFNKAVLDYIQQKKIKRIFLVACWDYYLDPANTRRESFKSALLQTVSQLVSAGATPFILSDVPTHAFPVSRALALYYEKNPAYLARLCSKPGIPNEMDAPESGFRKSLENAGVRILDPKPRFLDAAHPYYRIELNGVPLYRDQDHLTPKGAKLILLPFLRENLADYSNADQDKEKSR